MCCSASVVMAVDSGGRHGEVELHVDIVHVLDRIVSPELSEHDLCWRCGGGGTRSGIDSPSL